MAKSMTGFGRSELAAGERKFTVEMKSVNNRYLDLNIRLPRLLNPFEADIRAELKHYINRGKVDVFITFEDLGVSQEKVLYNKTLAAEYLAKLHELAADFDLPLNVTAEKLSLYPDVLTVEDENREIEGLWEPLKECVDQAAEAFTAAREKEGDFITKDLLAKLDGMQKEVDFIAENAPKIVEDYRTRLYEKMKEVLESTDVDENRILQEAALYSDKVCVDEELVRLKSHIQAVRGELNKQNESVGRKLDFLAQEMNREANTILSKTDNVDSAGAAINLKTEIEKIREQIQNIE